MRFLDRDHLDELIANRENAAASGVPNALRIVREANNARRDGRNGKGKVGCRPDPRAAKGWAPRSADNQSGLR